MSENLRGRLAYAAAIILMAHAVYALAGDPAQPTPPAPNMVWVAEI